jgi:hypothetical protein
MHIWRSEILTDSGTQAPQDLREFIIQKDSSINFPRIQTQNLRYSNAMYFLVNSATSVQSLVWFSDNSISFFCPARARPSIT